MAAPRFFTPPQMSAACPARAISESMEMKREQFKEFEDNRFCKDQPETRCRKECFIRLWRRPSCVPHDELIDVVHPTNSDDTCSTLVAQRDQGAGIGDRQSTEGRGYSLTEC